MERRVFVKEYVEQVRILQPNVAVSNTSYMIDQISYDSLPISFDFATM